MKTTAAGKLVCQVLEVAQVAGEAILGVYQEGRMDRTLKADGSPVTHADMLAHGVILDALRDLTPDVPVLSEECDETAYQDRRQWPTYWLVDPLDGTKEFLSGTGEFTVNIALIDGERCILGVLRAPALNLSYYAVADEGAFRINGKTDPVRVAAAAYSGGPLRVVVSRSHSDTRLNDLLQTLRDCECLPAGSSLKFCLVAEGTAHMYPRLGPTTEWDTAAGHYIVEAAGGHVVDLQGLRLRYNKPSLLNPEFVACGRFDSAPAWVSVTPLEESQILHGSEAGGPLPDFLFEFLRRASRAGCAPSRL